MTPFAVIEEMRRVVDAESAKANSGGGGSNPFNAFKANTSVFELAMSLLG